MPTAENAKLEYEAGQTAFAMSALTNSGDNKKFTSEASLWSGKSGSEANVLPDGLATGGAVAVAVSGSNDVVDVSALTCYLSGILTTVSAGIDTAITRPATAVSQVNSITINSSGAITVAAGTDGATTAFDEARGSAGGPPYVPVGSIEIAQVRMISNTPAPIVATEIFAVIGTHLERYDFPIWDEDNSLGQIEFNSSLPLVHTADAPKGVSASYADPIFAEVGLASGFTAPETSHSVASTQIYNKTLGSTSKSLGQGGFTAYLTDAITDALVVLKNEKLWFKFTPDRYKVPYILTQGILGIARTWGASDNIQGACTISAEDEAKEVAS